MTKTTTEIINWRQLSNRFKTLRGKGVSYQTIQGWQALGMPYLRQGRLIYYCWDQCFDWYLEQFGVGIAL